MLELNDIVYMIVVDRFADGDPTNNDDVDPADPLGRHGGDLLGIVQRMPYLKDLGVTVLWITPVYVNPPRSYHGYHPLDFESVDPHLCSRELGPARGREPLRQFVEIAHASGFKVMVDMIVSHTGEGHPWLADRPTWIDWQGQGVEKEWFRGLPNLNHDNLDVNVYFLVNILDWMVECKVDAVRVDAVRHVESQFWRNFKLYTQGLLPGTTVVGEFWDGDPRCVAPFQNLHGFHCMFDFPLYHGIRDVCTGGHGFGRLARPRLSDHETWGILDLDDLYRNPYQLLTFIGNHDTPRFFETAGGASDPEGAVRRMRMAMTLLMTTRGIPQLYYGDELAVPGGDDPDNRRDMPWHWLEPNNASAEADRGRQMHAFTQSLIALRRSSPALCWGMRAVLYVTPGMLVYASFALDDIVITCLNNADGHADIVVSVRGNPQIPLLMQNKLIDGLELQRMLEPGDHVTIAGGGIRIRLDGFAAAVFRARLPAQLGPARLSMLGPHINDDMPRANESKPQLPLFGSARG